MKIKAILSRASFLLSAFAVSAGAMAVASPPVVMKVLVLANSKDDLGYLSISTYLNQLGTPYQAVFVSGLTPDSSGNRLSTVPLVDTVTGNGLYQGIIQTDSSFSVCTTTCQSQLSSSDWSKLTNYELQYGVRVATYYTYPDAQWGLLPADSGASYSETSPLQVSLTSAGSAVFSYLNPANPVPVGGKGSANIWAYRATPTAAANEVTTPLLTAGQYTVAVTHKTADGRETMAMTMDNYPGLIHSTAFAYGIINWVTRGVFLGSRRVYLNAQIDDLLLGNRLYAPSLPQCPNDPSCPTLFATAQDLQALAAWQTNLQADPQFQSVRSTYAYNGIGTTWFAPSDPIFTAISSLSSKFSWLSHTWDHANLDCYSTDSTGACVPATLAQSLAELNQNISVASTLGVPLNRTSMVTPFNGGLTNPNFMQAAAQVGLQYIVTALDTPGPSLGSASPIMPSIYLIPRRSNNLFDDVSSPQTGVYGSWPDKYNATYGPNGTQPLYSQNQTYSQIINNESQDLFIKNMLTYEPYPLAYHIDNAATYDGTHSMMTDLFDAAIAKYKKIFTLPVITLEMNEIGTLLKNRASYDASGAVGIYTPGVGVTITTKQDATIPVTGICSQTSCAKYGGQIQDSVAVPANSTVTLSLGAIDGTALNTISVNPVSVVGGTSSTATVTLSTPAPSGGVTVSLASSTSTASVPASITVPAGSSTASFSVSTAVVSVSASAVITASYNGVSKTASLTVNPAASAALSSLTVSPATVKGGIAAQGSVKLSAPAPAGGIKVLLSTNNTLVTSVPSSITIPAGASTGTFSVTTRSFLTSWLVKLTASYNGISKTANLTVTP